MKALIFDKKCRIEPAHPAPQPAAGEALIEVRRAGVCATDLEIVRGYLDFSGVLGHEFVGSVIAGSQNWLGKRVVGEINCVCQKCDMCSRGLANHCRERTVLGISGRDGVFAEHVVLPESNLHEVPEVVSDAQAVFVEPLAAAYQVLKQCPTDRHMGVAVLGSGRLGLLVAQVLQPTGCKLEVIGRNPHTLTFCDKHGIQARAVEDLIPRQQYDVIVECTGHPQGLPLALQLVRPRGTIILKSTHASAGEFNLAATVIHEVTIVGSRCGPFSEAIAALARQQIDVDTMISRTFRLDQGLQALQAAGDPNHIKVQLQIRS